MEGNGEDIVAMIECGLGAVAMMGIDIEAENAFPGAGESIAGEDDVVDVTEPGCAIG
jgi:hypothetical protein